MKNLLIAGVLLAGTILGFTLPADLMEWKDTQRLWQVEQQQAEEVSVIYDTDMTFTEKIRFLQEDDLKTIEMSGGKNFTEEKMIVHVKKELEELQTRGIVMLNDKELTYGVQRILCQMDDRDGNRSMILWELIAKSQDEQFVMTVDDETGKILTIYHLRAFEEATDAKNYQKVSVSDKTEYVLELDVAAQLWANYWGVDLVTTAVYDFPILDQVDEMEKEVQSLLKQGIEIEDAWNAIYEEWAGVAEGEVLERRMYATFEDEGGLANMNFRKNTEKVLFMIDRTINYGNEK